jgi:hypothetical protein
VGFRGCFGSGFTKWLDINLSSKGLNMTEEQFQFLASLRKNDLLLVNGRLRVLRDVHRSSSSKWKRDHIWFYFVILRCSWTNRPYTLYEANDMKNKRIELVARNFKQKDNGFVEAFARELLHPRPEDVKLSCCDVHGIY